jgi:hypothetical protein
MRLGLGFVVAMTLSALPLSRPRPSEPAQRVNLIEGLENVTCEMWTQNQRIPPESSQLSLYGTFNTWVAGFTFGARSKDPRLGAPSPAEVVKAMDRYCPEHPKAILPAAALAVVDSFIKK